MQNAAQNPSELAARISSAGKILFVCHGNIMRSPFAEAALRERIRGRADVTVRSSGLWFGGGKPANPRARACARSFGIDLESHRTRRIERTELLGTDIAFAMEVDHLVEIARRFPESAGKVYLLGCMASDGGPLEIADPLHEPDEVLEACFRRVDAAVARIAELVLRGKSSPAGDASSAGAVTDPAPARGGRQ
jgi:protein-tyrosine-phosphatase